MKRSLFLFIFVLIVALGFCTEPVARQATASSDCRRGITDPLPFPEGERLVYQVRYSKFIISAVVGRITFTFSRSREKPLTKHYVIRADVVSEGVMMSMLGIQVKDVFESFIDPGDFGVVRTRKNLFEGRSRSFQLAVFDRENEKVTYIVRDLTKPEDPPKVGEYPTRPWVQDMVSGTYYVRMQPISPGQSIRFPLSDEGETFDLEVKVHDPEEVETPLGRFKALRLEPLIVGEGRWIEREGEMFVWMTDDERRLPVAARLRGYFGTVTAYLVEEGTASLPVRGKRSEERSRRR